MSLPVHRMNRRRNLLIATRAGLALPALAPLPLSAEATLTQACGDDADTTASQGAGQVSMPD